MQNNKVDSTIKKMNDCFTKNVEDMQEFAKTNNIPILRSQTASLLSSMIKIKRPKNILEIGCAIGYSGVLILESAPKDAHLTTIENNNEIKQVAISNFKRLGLEKKVEIILGDALEVLNNLNKKEKKYDFIFLDGPKGQYIKYLPYLRDLLNQEGILFSDNVLYRGMVFSDSFIPRKKRAIVNNLQKFLTQITNDECLTTSILNIEDGISISVKGK